MRTNILRFVFIMLLLQAFFMPSGMCQQVNEINKSRLRTVVISEAAISTAVMIGLHYLWYKKFPKSRFHLFNDNAEWMYMDKIGHAATAYNVSGIQYDLMRWAGVNNKNAAWIGGLTALGMQTVVEIFDGFSTKWGFSKGDMVANIVGSALFVAQQQAWGEQRVRLKFSFHKTIYAKYYPAELGANKWQRWLKDYNGQTYWLSINPSSFMKNNTAFPKWLNASFGVGAEGMVGARSNPPAINGVSIPEFKRTRKFVFSVDADLKRIDNPNSKPKVLLSIPNILKMPAPAIGFKKDSAAKFSWIYF